uniref:AN1-type domain-containing protein n=1 Tax=Alexandrium monilatum TaxID=311494 RepID=A0A7S4Q403_9DINO
MAGPGSEGRNSEKASPAASGDDRECGFCGRRISLVESVMRCRCGLVFCERHRPVESHSCTFDWQGMQQQRLARENPKVICRASSIASAGSWCSEYEKHHPLARADERRTQQLHAVGFLCFMSLALRGVWLFLVQRRLLLLPQQLVLGYLLGLAVSRWLPQLLGCPTSSCRFCVFSWDAISMGTLPWCFEAECERLKEHLIFLLTHGKRNCLTSRLYNGPRTLPHIFRTVSSRLQELTSGTGRSCCG